MAASQVGISCLSGNKHTYTHKQDTLLPVEKESIFPLLVSFEWEAFKFR